MSSSLSLSPQSPRSLSSRGSIEEGFQQLIEYLHKEQKIHPEQSICPQRLCLKNPEFFADKQQRQPLKQQAFQRMQKILQKYRIKPASIEDIDQQQKSAGELSKCSFRFSLKEKRQESQGRSIKKVVQGFFSRNINGTNSFSLFFLHISNPTEEIEEGFFLSKEGAEKIEEIFFGTIFDSSEKPPLIKILKGSSFVFFHEEPYVTSLPSDYWNDWGAHSGYARETYLLGIYPRCLEYFQVLPLPQQTKVLEICGGDGLFAKLVLASSYGERVSSYTLIDLNAKSISKAEMDLEKERLANRATIIQGDITDEKIWGRLGSFDLIVGLGALNTEVLSDRKKACKVLDQISQHADSGAFLMLTGYTDMLIDFTDLESRSFTILNTMDPNGCRSFYVARRLL